MSLGSASPCNSDGPLSSDDSYLGEFSAERQNEQPVCSAYSLPPPEKVKIDFMPPVDVGELDIKASPHRGQIKEDGSYLTDANKKDGGGELVVASNGDLSVCTKIGKGTEFTLEWHLTDKGEVVFIFCISTTPKLYLALDRFSFAVRGMTDTEMHNKSDRYWKRVPFEKIGDCPHGSGYFALQYWGDAFDYPTPKNYYFVIDNKKIFKIAPVKEASEHGRLGLIQL